MSKVKGSRYEREVVDRFIDRGIDAKRQPLSGQLKDYPGDVVIDVRGNRLICECKRREDIPNSIYKWLDQSKDNDVLIMRKNRRRSVVVMYLDDFIDLIC